MSHFKNEHMFDITATDSLGSYVLILLGFIPLQCLIIIIVYQSHYELGNGTERQRSRMRNISLSGLGRTPLLSKEQSSQSSQIALCCHGNS